MSSKKSYPFIPTYIAAAAAVIALCPIRIYQYFRILEADTGFYSKTDVSVYLMYAVMAFIIIFSIAAAFVNRKNLQMKKINLSPVSGAIVFILSALGFIADAVSCFTDFFEIFNGYSYSYEKTQWKYVSEKGGVIILLEAVFGLVAGIYFCALASGHLAKKNIGPKLRTIALALPLWTVARLLMKFKTTISFINVSDLFLSLFAVVFTMLYLLYFAQTVSEVDNGESYYKMFAYGIPAAVFSVVCFIPRFILVVIGRDDLLCAGYGVEICDLLIPVMIVATLISRSYGSKKSKKA